MQQWICKTPVSREAAGHHAAVDLQDTSQRRSSRTSCSSGSAGHQSAEKQHSAAGHNAAVDLQDIRQQNRAGHQATEDQQDVRQKRSSRTSGC